MVGLFYDFRDKRTRKVTKGGYIIVFVLIVSGLVAATSQAIEIYRDDVREKEQKIIANKQTSTTNAILSNVNRSLNPIKNIGFHLVLSLKGSDPDIQAYFDRIGKDGNKYFPAKGRLFKRPTAQSGVTYAMKNINGFHNSTIWFNNKSDLFPSKKVDSTAYEVLSFVMIEVFIFKHFDWKKYKVNMEFSNLMADLRYEFYLGSAKYGGALYDDMLTKYFFDGTTLRIDYSLLNSSNFVSHGSGQIVSALDFRDCAYIFRVRANARPYTTPKDASRNKKYIQLQHDMVPDEVGMGINDNFAYWPVYKFVKFEEADGSWAYYYKPDGKF